METQISTRPYSGKEDIYTVKHLKWHVDARFYTKEPHDKCLTTIERITLMLHDEAYRCPQSRPNSNGFAPCIVYMSVDEAEKLQVQLAAVIAERRRADAEAKGNGSEQSS